MSKVLIRNGQIISMTSEQPEILESDILIEGNEIVSIANNILAEGVDKTIDARGKVVMPGLVNWLLNSLFAMTGMRGCL